MDGEHPIGYASRYGQRYNDINKYTWLSDGRLLWIDHEGTLLAGTRNHQIKLAPEPIEEVWVGPNDRVAVAAGTTDLWRVDLADETWERIEGTEQLPRDVAEPILSQVGANLSIAPSGTYAAAVVEGTLWRIPLDGNGEPTHLGSAGYPDTDVRHAAPKPLVDSPYWALRELVRTEDGEVRAALLNTETGDIMSATDAGIEGQPRGGTFPSPDGRWLAVPLRNGTGSLYVAPSSDLSAGSRLEGESVVKEWDQDTAAVIVFQSGLDEVVRLALPAGEPTTLVSAAEDVREHNVSAATTSVGAFIATGDTLSLVRDDGTMLAQTTFSDGVRLFDARGDRALVRRGVRLRYDPPSPLLLWDAGIAAE